MNYGMTFDKKYGIKLNLLKRVKNHIASIVLSGVILIIVVSCDVSSMYEEAEKAAIDNYLRDHPDLKFELKSSGLYYLEIKAGLGELADTYDTAYLKYTAMLLDSTVFETNIRTDNTLDTLIVPVNAGWLISGLDEGLTYMREGGESLLLIPSSLAYGSSSHLASSPGGYYFIRGYTPILIDVELVTLIPGP